MAGRCSRVRWVMAVGVVVRGMTACLAIAAAVVVVTLPLVVAVLVAIAVDGVAFAPSIRAGKLFFHLQHRSGASLFVTVSSGQANGCPVLQSMERM